MPVSCRAAILKGLNQPFEIRTIEVRDPGPGEVLLKMLASGLCQSDLHVIEGTPPERFPIVLGHEGIGRVAAIGEGVADVSLGDLVIPFAIPDCGECVYCKSGRTNWCVKFGENLATRFEPFTLEGEPVGAFVSLGTFSEYTVINEKMLTKINPNASPSHACCIACGVTTGVGAVLKVAAVRRGSSVGVFGVGGVGLSAVQGARLAGAGRIIAIDTNPAKEDVARRMGATDFVNIREVDDLVAHLMEMTGGAGLDYSFECVGIPSLARQALEATNMAWGVAVAVGLAANGKEYSMNPMTLQTGRRWTGTLMGGAKRQDVAHYVDMFVAGEIKLDDLVSDQLTLDEIDRGFEMMRNGEAVRSVVVFDT